MIMMNRHIVRHHHLPINHCVCVPAKSSQWKGTVLDQVPVNPSLYLIKYDGFDCIYGLELHSDERVVGLEVLPDRVGEERDTMRSFPVWAAVGMPPQNQL